jgi:hypothetical protein
MMVRVDFSSADSGMRGGGQPQPFTFQLRPEDYTDIRWYLEEFMDLPIGGSVLRANRIEQSLIQWGRDLYKAVFDYGDYRDVIRDLMRAESPHLLTIATSNGDILRLPWELMADERGALTRRDVTIRRQLETMHQPLAYDVGVPLRLLLVVSRPDNAGFIDPRHSTRAMLDALTSLGDNVNLILTFRANFRAKMRITLSSWDEQKNYRNPRTSRRHPSHHRAPQEDARGRSTGPTLPDQWQLARLASRLDDGHLVDFHPLRG